MRLVLPLVLAFRVEAFLDRSLRKDFLIGRLLAKAIVISTVESNFHVGQAGFYLTESHRLGMTVNVLADSNVKIVNQLIEAVFNQHNADRIGDFFAKNGKWHGGVLGTVEGVENMIGLFRSVFSAIPDLHLTVQEVIA